MALYGSVKKKAETTARVLVKKGLEIGQQQLEEAGLAGDKLAKKAEAMLAQAEKQAEEKQKQAEAEIARAIAEIEWHHDFDSHDQKEETHAAVEQKESGYSAQFEGKTRKFYQILYANLFNIIKAYIIDLGPNIPRDRIAFIIGEGEYTYGSLGRCIYIEENTGSLYAKATGEAEAAALETCKGKAGILAAEIAKVLTESLKNYIEESIDPAEVIADLMSTFILPKFKDKPAKKDFVEESEESAPVFHDEHQTYTFFEKLTELQQYLEVLPEPKSPPKSPAKVVAAITKQSDSPLNAGTKKAAAALASAKLGGAVKATTSAESPAKKPTISS